MIRHPGSDFLQERFLANERPDRAAEKGIHPRMKEVFPAVWTAIRDSSRRMGGERKNEPSANGDAAHIAGRPRRPGKAVRSVWTRLSVRPRADPIGPSGGQKMEGIFPAERPRRLKFSFIFLLTWLKKGDRISIIMKI
ncbi:MAG: hypothetical protein C6W56_01905 [Caldibacillus debilis]|jgi:hypothetical protein|nr:MAG: hypothetical protein C6W56_01905 [Caldibacillus debilis]